MGRLTYPILKALMRALELFAMKLYTKLHGKLTKRLLAQTRPPSPN
jgi:hypothetical protein